MANKKYNLKEEQTIDVDDIIKNASDKDLMTIEFNDEYENIMRDHELVRRLFTKVSKLEAQIKDKV